MWFLTVTFPVRLAKLLFEFQYETSWYTACPSISLAKRIRCNGTSFMIMNECTRSLTRHGNIFSD
jgi:hypothetical protein